MFMEATSEIASTIVHIIEMPSCVSIGQSTLDFLS